MKGYQNHYLLGKLKLKPLYDTIIYLLDISLGKNWQYQVLTRKRSYCNSHSLLVGKQNSVATLGNRWQFLMKLNIHSPYNLQIPDLGSSPEGKIYAPQNIYENAMTALFIITNKLENNENVHQLVNR